MEKLPPRRRKRREEKKARPGTTSQKLLAPSPKACALVVTSYFPIWVSPHLCLLTFPDSLFLRPTSAGGFLPFSRKLTIFVRDTHLTRCGVFLQLFTFFFVWDIPCLSFSFIICLDIPCLCLEQRLNFKCLDGGMHTQISPNLIFVILSLSYSVLQRIILPSLQAF